MNIEHNLFKIVFQPWKAQLMWKMDGVSFARICLVVSIMFDLDLDRMILHNYFLIYRSKATPLHSLNSSRRTSWKKPKTAKRGRTSGGAEIALL